MTQGRVIKVARHWSDELDSVQVEHDGPVLVESTDDGSCIVHFRLGGDPKSIENFAGELRVAADDAWKLVPPQRPTPIEASLPPETVCRECKEPQSRHMTRGGRLLECPNRCPNCDDQAVFSARVDDIEVTEGLSPNAVWVMDMGEGEPPTEIYFCPFCGLDLRGTWLLGVPQPVK